MRPVVFGFCSIWVGFTVLLAGCQQVAWKPGAGAAELNRDTAACRAQSEDEAAVKNCLRMRGWSLRGSAAGNSDADEEEVAAGDPAVVEEPKGNTNGPARDKLVPVSSAPVAASAPAPSTAAPLPASEAAKSVKVKKPKVVDPLKPKLVQSWWKVGAGAPELAADQAACADTLGAAHQPDQQKRLYTQGLIDCMRARGWSSY